MEKLKLDTGLVLHFNARVMRRKLDGLSSISWHVSFRVDPSSLYAKETTTRRGVSWKSSASRRLASPATGPSESDSSYLREAVRLPRSGEVDGVERGGGADEEAVA